MLRLCAKVDKVDDLLMYGYKLLGKNKAGQNVYRQVLENPINRGFHLRTYYPETFQATSFAYVDDAGRVTDQFIRKVGTVGSTTSPTRINTSEFTKLNLEGNGTTIFHMTETTPKAGKFHVWDERINPKKGIEWQKVVYDANNQGKLDNAIMQVEYKSPLVQGKNLKGWYNIQGSYVRNPEATLRQNGVKEARYRIFADSPKYEPNAYVAQASIGEIKYPHSISALKQPGFYRQYAGPLESKPGIQVLG